MSASYVNQETWMKPGDTEPALAITCTDGPGGAVVNLSTATAINIVFEQPRPGGVITRAAALPGDPNGVVVLDWQEGDTAYLGDMPLVVKVTWPGGGVQTFPVKNTITVHVVNTVP